MFEVVCFFFSISIIFAVDFLICFHYVCGLQALFKLFELNNRLQALFKLVC